MHGGIVKHQHCWQMVASRMTLADELVDASRDQLAAHAALAGVTVELSQAAQKPQHIVAPTMRNRRITGESGCLLPRIRHLRGEAETALINVVQPQVPVLFLLVQLHQLSVGTVKCLLLTLPAQRQPYSAPAIPMTPQNDAERIVAYRRARLFFNSASASEM